MIIKKNTIIKKSDDLLAAPLDESLALMSVETGKYYGLNPVARAIWERIEKPTSFQNIIDYLLNRFEIDAETCEKESSRFLKELLERKIIILKE